MRLFSFLAGLLFLFGCTQNNVTEAPELEKYFEEAEARGTFALLSNNNGEFTIYNLERYRDSSYLPASTFKIVNSLIGLQTGDIVNENMVIAWDGVERFSPDWNKDLTMREAFRVSAVNYYQEVARRIGKDTMQFWLDSISYGSRKITTSVDSFWLDNSLTITPDEQLGLVKQLYFRELPFHEVYQDKVKQLMLFEDKPEYKLSYKTGWGRVGNRQIGWILGYIEENGHPYFFVLNLESDDPNYDMVGRRMKLLKSILSDMGFMEGKK